MNTSKYDPQTASRIAGQILEQQNPPMDPGEDLDALNEAKVTELFETLHKQGIQISSLKESALRQHCARLGMTEVQVNAAIDEWLSWAVTDDVSA